MKNIPLHPPEHPELNVLFPILPSGMLLYYSGDDHQ
jgi:hypothetical protein